MREMAILSRPRVLITGASGQVGRKTIDFLSTNKEVEIIAAVRSSEKAVVFQEQGIATVYLDFDDEKTHLPAFENVNRVLIITSYTVDMLRQSKSLLDSAKKAGVQHVVHLGACGSDDTTVAHWAWHQLVERYVEWCGFTFTHLRPEEFMQNLLSYGGEKTIINGIIQQYVEGARKSWVDVNDVAEVAALSLLHPETHGGQTYRMGYDARSYYEIADLMTKIIGKPFQYQPLDPAIFLQKMMAAGAEMAYMNSVYDHFKRYAQGTIPGADEVFNNFFQITGRQPMTWDQFIMLNKDKWDYNS